MAKSKTENTETQEKPKKKMRIFTFPKEGFVARAANLADAQALLKKTLETKPKEND